MFGMTRSSRQQPQAPSAPSPEQPQIPVGASPAAHAQSGMAPGAAFGGLIPPAEAAAAELSLEPGQSGLDFDAFEREWNEAGSLSDESYERLGQAGIPREIVDAYVAGQKAMGDALRKELLDSIGGEEGFAVMADWARRSLSPADIDAYEAALQGTPEQAKLALRGLQAAWSESTGRRPNLVGGQPSQGGEGSFLSAQQLAEAIRDPRYKRDPAYREDVQARLARSNVFGRR